MLSFFSSSLRWREKNKEEETKETAKPVKRQQQGQEQKEKHEGNNPTKEFHATSTRSIETDAKGRKEATGGGTPSIFGIDWLQICIHI